MSKQNKDWTSKLAVKKVALATELLNSGNDALVKAMVERGISDAIQNAVPVSYTHLRAHETVLDLVCRLLLEKKKHKDKQTN